MLNKHLANQILANPPLVSDNTLHVIGIITNTSRYHSRYRLFREWYKQMLNTPNVKVYVVEAAYGDRAHEVTVEGDPTHLQLRTKSEIWVKENLINLGVKHLLPINWKYMAWVDCDITFRDNNWALEAIQQAQHFSVLQPWQNVADLGPRGEINLVNTSFGYLYQNDLKMQTSPEQPYDFGHPGYAWVCRRDWYEAAGGLMDFAILGSGDHHMAWCCVGQGDKYSVHSGMSDGYKRKIKEWQDKVVRITNKDVGYSNGRIEHDFHGSKVKRAYRSRWQILIDNKYDPYTDLIYDEQGLIQIVGKPELEIAIRKYNRSRDEDGTES